MPLRGPLDGGAHLRFKQHDFEVVERHLPYARFYGFEKLTGIESAPCLELVGTITRLCTDCCGRISSLQAWYT